MIDIIEYAITSVAFFMGSYVAFLLPYVWLGIVLGIFGILFLIAVVVRIWQGN